MTRGLAYRCQWERTKKCCYSPLAFYMRKNSHKPLNICLILCKVLISLFVKHIIFPPTPYVVPQPARLLILLPSMRIYAERKNLRGNIFPFVWPGIFFHFPSSLAFKRANIFFSFRETWIWIAWRFFESRKNNPLHDLIHDSNSFHSDFTNFLRHFSLSILIFLIFLLASIH